MKFPITLFISYFLIISSIIYALFYLKKTVDKNQKSKLKKFDLKKVGFVLLVIHLLHFIHDQFSSIKKNNHE